jgi:hypothetical protein
MKVCPDARELARRWFEEVWNARRDASIDELLSADSYGHTERGEYKGPDGDRAAVRWRALGTHSVEGRDTWSLNGMLSALQTT